MKSYLTVKVLTSNDKVILERCFSDCSIDSFEYNTIIRALHVLYPTASVVFESKLPKKV